MPANGRRPTIEELLARGWKAIDGGRDYLNEFLARMNNLEKLQDEFERTLPCWQLPESINLAGNFKLALGGRFAGRRRGHFRHR
ncbi:MAG TPA: hypothetical protein VJX16_02360 [Terriglobales bacterium]|nr:hypothetical protein [Terriglobales bacterium]